MRVALSEALQRFGDVDGTGGAGVSLWTQYEYTGATTTWSAYSTTNFQRLLSWPSSSQLEFYMHGTRLSAGVGSAACLIDGVFDGGWHHVFITANFSSGGMQCYLDSLLKAEIVGVQWNDFVGSRGQTLFIGGRSNGGRARALPRTQD